MLTARRRVAARRDPRAAPGGSESDIMDDENDGWGLPAGRREEAVCAEGERLPVARGEARAEVAAEAGPAAVKPAFVRVCYSDEVAWEICARVAAGESLMAICRDAHMPNRQTIGAWRYSRPAFGEALMAAMQAVRYRRRRAELARAMRPRDARGVWSAYTPELGAEICRRLTEGESLKAICRDEGMPCYATVLNWARAVPAFGDAYAMARRLATDALFDEAREIALSTRPGTVWADRLRFDIIRWQVARTAARKYVETMPELEAAKRAAIERKLAAGWQEVLDAAAEEDEGEG